MRGAMIMAFVIFLAGSAVAGVRTLSLTEKSKSCEIEFKYPQFGHDAIDAAAADWAKELRQYFRDLCKTAADDPVIRKTGGRYTAELNFEVHRNDAKAVSVSYVFYTYTGGAHPNTSIFGQTFLKPDGRRVFIAELVGAGGLKKLSAFAIADLKRQWDGQIGDLVWLEKGAGPNAHNLDDFVWNANGDLLLLFSPYQVAAYAAGPQDVTVPAKELKGMLRPDIRAPQPSFDCARAGTAIERAICGDWRLARADRQMSEDYTEMLAYAYEADAIAKLKTDQRAWLKARDAHCGQVAEAQMAGCLMPLMEARRKAIDAPRF